LRILEKRWKSKEINLKKLNNTGSFLDLPALQLHIFGTNQQEGMAIVNAMSSCWFIFGLTQFGEGCTEKWGIGRV